MQRLRGIGAMAIDAVYPPTCLTCEARVQGGHGLCPECWRDMPFIRGAACRACGAPLPGEAGGAEATLRCDQCLAAPRPWDEGRAALLYEGAARRFVLGLKHGDRLQNAEAGGEWLLRAARGLVGPDTVFVPVPLHRWRLWRRRYNQAALLAQAMARQSGARFEPMALRRTRRTPRQSGHYGARFANMAGAVSASPHAARLEGRRVALVDDVMTSGATLAACTEALRDAGAARIDVLCLARVARM